MSSAIGGLSSAQSMFDAAARRTTADSLPDSPPSDDLIGAVVGMHQASAAVSVNVAVLRMAGENERSLIDIFA